MTTPVTYGVDPFCVGSQRMTPIAPELRGAAAIPDGVLDHVVIETEGKAYRDPEGEAARRAGDAVGRQDVGFICSSIAAICRCTRLTACSGRIITRNSMMRPSSLQRMMSTPFTYLPSTVVSNSSTAVSPASTCFV